MAKELSVTKRLKGPVVPLNICFTDDDEVDFSAMRKYVNWLCEQKVPVLMLTYGSSEFSSLTEEEIWRLTAELAEEVSGRSVFIASTDWCWPGRCREFLKHAEESGVDAVKIQTHPGLEMNRKVLLEYFDYILDAASIPLLLWSPAMPTSFPVDVASELAKRPQIVGIKNDGDQFYDYYDLIRAAAGQDFAVISGGQMRNFVYGYQLGSAAYLCTVAPFRPDIALEFYNLLIARRFDDAWQMVFSYEELWLKTACELNWLLSIKSAMNLYGLFPNNRLRCPNVSHTTEQREKVRQCLDSVFGPIEKVDL